MEYKHLLDICEQLLKHSALPQDMLDKYYRVKERTLRTPIECMTTRVLQLVSQCLNQMLTQRDINITYMETQITHLLDTQGELRTELTKTFQLLLQLNSERKEQDQTIGFLQNETKKLKLEQNINGSKAEQTKKLQEQLLRLQKHMEELREEHINTEAKHREQIQSLEFKYENDPFFDQFAEMSLPYLERFEREFERHQGKHKKYGEQINEKEILLDFLFYLLNKYVPDVGSAQKSGGSAQKSASKGGSAQKSTKPLEQSLHFEQYKGESKIDETYKKLKQELLESRKTLEKYEVSRNKLSNQLV